MPSSNLSSLSFKTANTRLNQRDSLTTSSKIKSTLKPTQESADQLLDCLELACWTRPRQQPSKQDIPASKASKQQQNEARECLVQQVQAKPARVAQPPQVKLKQPHVATNVPDPTTAQHERKLAPNLHPKPANTTVQHSDNILEYREDKRKTDPAANVADLRPNQHE
jgi:hypothetical protein